MGSHLSNVSHLERFSTANVLPAERLTYWKKLTQETFGDSIIEAPVGSARNFGGHLSRWQIGDLLLTRARASSSSIGRQPAPQDRRDRITLHFQHLGSGRQIQGDRSCELKTGDFTLANCSEYFLNSFPCEHEMLAVEAPLAMIAEYAPNFEEAMSRTISGNTPGGRMLHDFLLSLWRQEDEEACTASWSGSIQTIYLELLSMALAQSTEARPNGSMLNRIKQLIEARIHDPLLRTASIAEELNVSPRTVQLAFAPLHTTPSAHIMERRMVLAAEYLLSAPHMSITDIAMELGFNECSYFTRCFRKHFAMTPMAYRMRS